VAFFDELNLSFLFISSFFLGSACKALFQLDKLKFNVAFLCSIDSLEACI
jgi:hypothetical protein